MIIIPAILMMTGCANEKETTTEATANIDAEEVLAFDSNADIFKFDGVIYKTNIDWVEDLP